MLKGAWVACVLGVVQPMALASPPEHDDPHGAPAAAKSTKVERPAKDEKPAAPERAAKTEPKADLKTEPKTEKAELPPPRRETATERRPLLSARSASVDEEPRPTNGAEALRALQQGNQRWAEGRVTNPRVDAERRQKLADEGQKPFVSVLTCADSRVPAERIFDQGIGDTFVVRVAGNVAEGAEIGTLEYGLGHLKTPLLVVMGHTKCGAVAAAATDAPVHGMVKRLVADIDPAVARAKRNNPGASKDELAQLAVKENVWQGIYDVLKSSETCRELVASGQVMVVGAVYDIATGKIEWLGEHPWQSEILGAIQASTKGGEAAGGKAEATAKGSDKDESGH